LDVICTLVHASEQAHHAIPFPDPIDAIKYLMEENGWKNKDLEQFIGPKSRVSGILCRKRYFTLQQIHNQHRPLSLPLEMFINEKTMKAV
jgi:HTH-type transcriptional regulator/antitoxin HigA